RSAAGPTPAAFWGAGGLAFAALTVLVILGLRPGSSSPNDVFATVLTTLWQAHIALAGLALPVLVFIIELAKDDISAFAPSSEVLVRRTLAFPIIAFVL